jgi:hypothetical protein
VIALRPGWVISRRADLLVFAGPVLVSGAIAWAARGSDADGVPVWAFLLLVVGCDVAHVWATLFRTYLDPEERARRPALLAVTPLACLAAGACLHAADPRWFWRVLAYVAAFHFVRQQWGWMALSARRAGETSRLDRRLDHAAVHAATIAPLVWWHANLPLAFEWFRPGDFVAGLPPAAGTVALVLEHAVLLAWLVRQGVLAARGSPVNPAKALVLASTYVAWNGGIVWLDGDLAFTASNVLAHGVPYFALVRTWGRARFAGSREPAARLFRPGPWAAGFYGALIALAFLEEGLWDRLYSHERGGVFPGPAVGLDDMAAAVVAAALAVPQATHYVLDAFLWRGGARNPGLLERLGFPPSAPREATSPALRPSAEAAASPEPAATRA